MYRRTEARWQHLYTPVLSPGVPGVASVSSFVFSCSIPVSSSHLSMLVACTAFPVKPGAECARTVHWKFVGFHRPEDSQQNLIPADRKHDFEFGLDKVLVRPVPFILPVAFVISMGCTVSSLVLPVWSQNVSVFSSDKTTENRQFGRQKR